MKVISKKCFAVLLIMMIVSCKGKSENILDLSNASILISKSIKKPVYDSSGEILVEEIGKRANLNLSISDNWNSDTVIALAITGDKELYAQDVPKRSSDDSAESKKEGFRLFHEKRNDKNILWILGADARGVLFGIGQLLRKAQMHDGKIVIDANTDYSSSPEYEIRGHQFGYRDTANSWDSWTVDQFDQHFREQILFGANSFENIPFQDERKSVHFKMSREEMNVHISEICEKYDADYWIWAAVEGDLKDDKVWQDELDKCEALFKAAPRFDAMFFPGGDPGENHPSEVLPFLEELTTIMHKYHPEAEMWISLQGFNREKVEYFFEYVKNESPDWLTGVANGPSSPSLDVERKHLPKKYKLRAYPDLTHTVRCQYPVKRWDQAFALTLGRECTNPQPRYYAELHNRDAVYTDGFLAYSDGIHDDVNKITWSQMAWDTNKDVRNVMVEYSSFFFGAHIAEKAADGILAMEQNWVGPALGNSTIKETLKVWKELESENPLLKDNWRWQQLVMRAYYDAYVQERLAYEKNLENEANEILATASSIGVDEAMESALKHIQKADSEFVAQELKQKVVAYCDDLFESIGLQTSVLKYNASGYERGAILDFIDYPLNNRWWLEDEFEKITKLETEKEKLAKLDFIRNYENPGVGSFYDNISSADAKHVTSETDDAIDYLWEENGFSRKRLTTQLFQFSPVLEYDELDSNSNYLIRVSGYGEALLRANGKLLKPTKYEKDFEQFKEFPLSKELIKDGNLKITFDKPDEEHLNWRKQSRVTDVWVLKQ